MNILNLFKRDTEDSEPLLLDGIEDEELSEECREALSDPSYFSKFSKLVLEPANTTVSATAIEDVEILIPPHTFESQIDNDRQ